MKKTWWFSWSLAPFWLPFGSLLAPFGSLLAPFECQTSSKILFLFDLVSPFADVRNHFCKKVNVGTLSARTRIVGTPICGNPSLRPRAELCRRHLDYMCIRTWSLPPSVFASVVGSLSALAFLHLPSALAFLHFPFALHFLHSTLYSPLIRLS